MLAKEKLVEWLLVLPLLLQPVVPHISSLTRHISCHVSSLQQAGPRHYISELLLETDVKDEYMIIGRFEIIAILYTSFSVTSERGCVQDQVP
jgi:hypothetical protein